MDMARLLKSRPVISGPRQREPHVSRPRCATEAEDRGLLEAEVSEPTRCTSRPGGVLATEPRVKWFLTKSMYTSFPTRDLKGE